MDAPLLRLAKVRREFPAGEETITVLRDVDLEIRAGEFIAIVGASGSGKSTLMNILGCLDRPTAGSYQVAGRETSEMLPDELAELRREHFGFIFQRYHLLGDLTATANAEVPAIYAGRSHSERRSTYSTSRASRSGQSRLLRPVTWARPVSPGRTSKRRRCSSVKRGQ